MPNLRGKWTVPGRPYPSSHLIDTIYTGQPGTRCGRPLFPDNVPAAYFDGVTDEPQSNVRVCERCSVLSRRDG